MDPVNIVDVLATAARVAFEKESRSLQFHDQVIKLLKERDLEKGGKHVPGHKPKETEPKAVDHGSPLIGGKPKKAEPSTKIQEKSAAKNMKRTKKLLRGATSAAKKLTGGGHLDVGADKAVAALKGKLGKKSYAAGGVNEAAGGPVPTGPVSTDFRRSMSTQPPEEMTSKMAKGWSHAKDKYKGKKSKSPMTKAYSIGLILGSGAMDKEGL